MSFDNAYGRMLADKVQSINQRKVKNMGSESLMTGRGSVNSYTDRPFRPLTEAVDDASLKRVIGGARLNRARYAWDEDKVSNPARSVMVERPDTSSVRHSALNQGSGLFSSVLGSFGLGSSMDGGAMAFGEMKEGGKKTRGRPKKQTQKDREDERLAMEVKGLKDVVEGGAMAFGKMKRGRKCKGGAMAFGEMKSNVGFDPNYMPSGMSGKGILSDLVGSFGLGMESKGPDSQAMKSMKAVKGGARMGLKGGMVRQLIPVQAMKGDSMSGGKKSVASTDGRKARAAIVRQVMAEKGLSMIEASKFVKQNNLY